MKRLLKLAIVMLAAMMVLTGCGNNGETERKIQEVYRIAQQKREDCSGGDKAELHWHYLPL